MARLYLALCDVRTGVCLSPYSTFTAADNKRQFQLRVFVNTGQNGFQFQKTSKAAYKYYLSQVGQWRRAGPPMGKGQVLLSQIDRWKRSGSSFLRLVDGPWGMGVYYELVL